MAHQSTECPEEHEVGYQLVLLEKVPSVQSSAKHQVRPESLELPEQQLRQHCPMQGLLLAEVAT